MKNWTKKTIVKEVERLNKVKITKTKKIRKDANDVAQKEYIYVCVYMYMYIYVRMYVCINIVCGFRLFIDFIV